MITENKIRIGRFTSSEICALTTLSKNKNDFGVPAINYINEKKIERRLGRGLTTSIDARPTLWGKCLESRIFNLLGLEYKLCSQETIPHPEYDFWAGSPDAEKFDEGKTVADIKCPYTLKSFCNAYHCKTIDDFREEHNDGEKYFWQVVSNSILTGAKYGELIFYCPYYSELDEVRKHSIDIEFTKIKNEYAWIFHALDSEIPYLPDGCYYKNIHTIRWEISQKDKDFLTEKVIKANRLIN